jgi:3-oxoacyl-[acyl-carrier-protein] synthase III
MEYAAFGRFVSLNEHDAPELLQRMANCDLPIDGSRYGVSTRLIARLDVQVSDLAAAVLKKLFATTSFRPTQLGAIVLSSRITEPTKAARRVAEQLGLTCYAEGIERACSGFPAATRLALQLCHARRRPVAVVAVEIISRSINWEPASGGLRDHRRARGQAAKLFADGAAAVIIRIAGPDGGHAILDAWQGEVPDEQQLIQKIDVENAFDPWGGVLPGSTTCISMPGRRGFWLVKRAPLVMADAVQQSVENAREAGLLGDEMVSHIVPHQPNGLILARLQKHLREAHEAAEVCNCIEHMGNTVSASIPSAMSKVQDRLPVGSLVAMPSVGAGGPGYRPDVLSVGCVLLRIGEGCSKGP